MSAHDHRISRSRSFGAHRAPMLALRKREDFTMGAIPKGLEGVEVDTTAIVGFFILFVANPYVTAIGYGLSATTYLYCKMKKKINEACYKY